MKNTAGTAEPRDYLLGKGAIYFALLSATTQRPLAWRFLGNAPDMKVTPATNTLQHLSSLEGLQTVDSEVTISQALALAFTLEEFNDENKAMFLSGETADYVNGAVAGFTVYVMVADGDLAQGRYYDLISSTGVRAYGIDPTHLTVTTNEGTPVSLVQGVDYTVDADMGRIFMVAGSTKTATAITANKGLKVTLTADSGAPDVDEVRAMTQTTVTGAIKFNSLNPADNSAKAEYQFHKVNLGADGDVALIGTAYSSMGFKASAQQNSLASPNSPTLTIRQIPTR